MTPLSYIQVDCLFIFIYLLKVNMNLGVTLYNKAVICWTIHLLHYLLIFINIS